MFISIPIAILVPLLFKLLDSLKFSKGLIILILGLYIVSAIALVIMSPKTEDSSLPKGFSVKSYLYYLTAHVPYIAATACIYLTKTSIITTNSMFKYSLLIATIILFIGLNISYFKLTLINQPARNLIYTITFILKLILATIGTVLVIRLFWTSSSDMKIIGAFMAPEFIFGFFSMAASNNTPKKLDQKLDTPVI